MDFIFIRDLRIDATIGIYDWERKVKQTLIFDLEMGTDIRPAAASDDIADTLDYKTISKRLQAFVSESRFLLVEKLAERCAEIIITEFPVPWLRLTLNKKGAVSIATDVGLTIERTAEDYPQAARAQASDNEG
ncbi:MAG: dihydroneopterin aldolase [Gammaproteobacteria bacterium]